MISWMPRDAWDRRNLERQGHRVDPHQRTEIAVHHTVTVDDDPTPDTWETPDEVVAHMQRLQVIRPDLGYDVPYSVCCYLMADGGVVMAEGRGLYRTGAHTKGRNTSALGIAFVGNFHDEPKSENLGPYLHQIRDWIRSLERMGFVNLHHLYGHQDVDQTACPGRHLYPLLSILALPGWTIRRPHE